MFEGNRTGRFGALLPGVVAASLALCWSSPAGADAAGCRASALRLTGAGALSLEPTVANAPGIPCASQDNSLVTAVSPLNSLLSLDAVSTRTDATPGSASARAGVIAPLFFGTLGGVSLSALTAEAHQQCADGALPSGRSEVVGLTVNGTSFGTVDNPLTINVPSLGTLYLNRTIPSDGGVTQRAFELVLLANLAGGLAGADLVLGEASVSAAHEGCDGSTSGHVPGVPGGAEREAGAYNGGAGQGRGSRGGGAAPGSGSGIHGGTLAARQAAAALALQCSDRRLVLIDVLTRKKGVALFGAADKRLIGKRVAIGFIATHRRVASAVVGPDGFFATTAPLPARRLRLTNRARYRASVGGERSAPLKLTRRMIVSSISSGRGKVFLHGRVTAPWAHPMASVLISRRVSCRSRVVVKRVRPNRKGFFSAVLPAPPRAQAAVYEASTRVRATASSRRTYPTFTLPREVLIR